MTTRRGFSPLTEQARELLVYHQEREKLSNRELAARSGISHTTVARIRSGDAVPAMDTFDHLMRSFGVQIVLEAVPI